MTLDTLVDDIFIKEGDVYSEPPANDQPTGRGGIIAATLTDYWRAKSGPQSRGATKEDLQALTHEEARAVVEWKLMELARAMRLGWVVYQPLYLQLLDFGYNSGGERACRWFQRVLEVPMTGTVDDVTLAALGKHNPRMVNQALIAARCQMLSGWAKTPFQKSELPGLVARAVTFSSVSL